MQQKTNNKRIENYCRNNIRYLATRETIEKILEAYTVLEENNIKACLEFAKSETF